MALVGRRALCCLALLASTAACTRPGSTAATTTATTSPEPSTTTSTTTEVTTPATATSAPTSPPTSSPTTTTATTAPIVTSTPSTDHTADQLAGARVLCSYAGPDVPDDLLARLRDGDASGVLWFGKNVPDIETATRNAAAIQAAAAGSPDPAPAIVATDQEGGDIRRIPGPPEASAVELGRQGPATIRDQAGAAATTLLTWGADVDLAPVADIARTGSFEDSQQRSFGTDPAAVGDDVAAFVDGLHDGGVAATLKHFPGLGAAVTNTDVAPSVVDLTTDVMRSIDFPPFATGIAAGADLVMVSSAEYPSLDSEPAIVSSPIVHDLLRDELGFDGVVVSDAFDSGSVAALGPIGDVAVRAANAGVDMFLFGAAAPCVDVQKALSAAITDGRIPRAAAEATYDRIMRLRRRLPIG